MAVPRFDLPALFRAIDAERSRQELSWASLARQVGVAASTIRRFRTAENAEADGVLALVRWLGVAPEAYVAGSSLPGDRLDSGGMGHVRVDMDLVAEVTPEAEVSRGRTRTTIQHLVAVAGTSQRTVASLTRLSAY